MMGPFRNRSSRSGCCCADTESRIITPIRRDNCESYTRDPSWFAIVNRERTLIGELDRDSIYWNFITKIEVEGALVQRAHYVEA